MGRFGLQSLAGGSSLDVRASEVRECSDFCCSACWSDSALALFTLLHEVLPIPGDSLMSPMAQLILEYAEKGRMGWMLEAGQDH
jgi:hypothetical protein